MKRINKTSAVIFLTAVMFLFTAAVSSAALLGDIDQNGKITASDARFVLRASVGLEKITDEQIMLADADFNGKITAADARLILRASVGLEQLGETEKEHDFVTEITEATCKKEGIKTVTCKNCSYKITEVLEKLPHTMGEWKIVSDSTAENEGYERSTCSKCGYYTDRKIPVKEAVYYLTVNEDAHRIYKVPVAADGKYALSTPHKAGYEFKGWVDNSGNTFSASGVITGDTSCSAVWELADTDSIKKLVNFAAAGADKIKITADITVSEPIYVPYETTVYSDGDYSLTRSPSYKGDIFVVGSDKYGYASVDKGKKAVLTLGGGEGMLTIDGNRDNITVDVNGSCVFVADSSELNLYDGVKIINNYKTSNERINRYSVIMTETSRFRAGGAAIVNITSTVNMYGGIIENNEVATEFTETDNGDGTVTQTEDNGCGGAVFNRGTFNMYGGVISNNTALRGGGIYNDKFCYLYSGEISNNLATVYGGALSSSSSSSADTFVGSREETDKQMLIKDNHSLRAGGSMYSNTSSPIVIYSNAVFEGNRSDTSGGAVYTAGPLVVEGATFTGNTCEYSGGAIYHHYTKADFKRKFIQLDNCSFESNKAGLGGAVILSSAGHIENEGTYAEITNCTFTKNEGIVTEINPGNGGAMYITRNSDAVIKNCSFSENVAKRNAGAVAIHSGATVTFTDITFNKNTASLGGAVYTSSDSVVTMKNVGFNENSAVMDENLSGGNGGAVYYAKANLTLNNVDFCNNTADNNAGAVYQNAATLKLDNTCDFIGNKAGNHGGALYLTYANNEDGTKTGSVLDAQNVTFKNNSALAGGAVSGRTATDITFNNVKFIENSTPEAKVSTTTGGGAVYSNNSDVKITDTLFDGNSSGYYGGALRLDSCVTSIKNTQVLNSSGGTGGAIYSSGEVLETENLTLKGNSSTLNGVMYITNKEASFKALEATDNTGVNGGVLYAGRKTYVKITDSVLSSNKAKHGGTLYVTAESEVNADNCEFSANTAEKGQGGAVYVNGATFNAVNGSSFTGNTATGHGGAISSQDIVTEIIPEPVPEDKPEDNPEDPTDDVVEPGSGDIPGDNPENPDEFPEETTEDISEGTSESTPVLVNEDTPESTTAEAPETTTEAPGGTSEPIIEKTYSHISLKDCTFDENTGSSGGAVYFNDTIYTVENCSFNKNTATNESYGGGAVYNTGATGKINNVTFTGNTALRGGAVAMYTNSEVEFSHITATGNEATAEGGVIYANKCSVDLTNENIVLKDNKANHGGAVYATRVPLFDIDGAVIEGNKASSNGGALYASGSTVNISGENTVIRNNEAAGHGGVIYLSYITESDSSKTGGVLNIDGVSLTDNKALYGGAVSGRTNSVINLQNITLSGNSTPDATSANKAGGGAIYTNNSALTLSGVTVSGNSSGYYGGAVFAEAAQVTINNNSVIKENNGGTGAAMYLTSGSSLEAENITVENNHSTANGIFYLSGKTFNFSGVTAKNNAAELSGGVIYVSGAADVDITDCVFQENTASNGGAVYHRSTKELTLSKTKFINNTASSNGGALDIVGSTVTASGENEFTENTAAGHGGAVYVTYIPAEGDTQARLGKFNVTDGIFEGNCAVGGGAVSIRSDCEAEFNGTVFKKNTVTGYEIKSDGTGKPDGNAEGGGAVYVGYGKLTLNNVTAEDNTASESVNEADNSVIKSFGGVVNAVKSEISITDGVYKNNKASMGGAFNIIDNSDVTVKGTAFENNESVYVNNDYDNTVGGGAVNIKGGTLSLDGVTMKANKTGYYGGALMAAGTKVDIFGNSKIQNNEGSTGAALHFKNKSEVTVTDTNISNNKSVYNGVLYANSSTLTLERVSAKDNEAVNGGVIFVSNSSTVVNVNNSTISSNKATKGGAAYTENATISFTESTISENNASSGGAVYSNNGKVNFNGGTVSSNTASSGGAVYGLENTAVNINATNLNENSASHNGGAVYVSRSEAVFTDAEFTSNSAANHGGVLYLAGSTLTANGNNSFTSNTANNHGGAVYVVYFDAEDKDGVKTRIPGVFTMENGTFTANTALGGGAVSIRSDCEATFTDTVFTSNSVTGFADEADGNGEGGGAIYVGFGTLTLNNVTADGNIATEAVKTEDNSVIKSFGGAVDAVASTVSVAGGTFSNNTASSGGAFHLMSKSKLTALGATLENNESVYVNNDYDSNIGGGAINATGGNLILDGVTLSGNKTDYYGGAVLYDGVTAEIKGGSVIENSEGGTGAALYFKNSCDVTVNNITVRNNTASNNGVIYANNSKLDITALEASDNISKNGGVLYTSNKNSVVTVKDSIISGNEATSSGGAVYTENATVSFTESEVSSNTAKNGGAVYSLGGKVSFSDSSATENSSISSGGAVYAAEGTVSITGTSFNENSTNNHGGAVYVSGATLTASGNNSFTANSAKKHGGAVYVVYYDIEQSDGTKTRIPGTLTMEGGTFTENTALGGGAASIRSDCEATFTDTVFTSNSVTGFADEADGDGEGGGAVYVGFGKLTLNNVTADSNVAAEATDAQDGSVIKSFGGAVEAVDSTVTVTGGTFSNNTASSGGAFHLMLKSALSISGATLENNESVYVNNDYDSDVGGGAINATDGELVLDGVTLRGNKTWYYGGAVLLSGTIAEIKGNSTIESSEGGTGAALYFKNSSTVTVTGAKIQNNTASANGVIYANSSKLDITGLEAAGNKARNGGVIYTSNKNTVIEINDSKFSGNTATASGGAVFTENATVSFTGSEISSNNAKNAGAVYSLGGKVSFSDSLVTNNSSTSSGGAVYAAEGTVSLTDTSFNENSTNNHGGAVYVSGASLTANGNNSFTSNSAKNHGGAVYVIYYDIEQADGTKTRIPCTLTMNGGTFTGNTALGGGAVSIRSDCEATFTGTVFNNNNVTGFSDKADGDGEGGGALYVGFGTLTLNNVSAKGNTASDSVNNEDNSVNYGFGGAVDSYNSTVYVTGGVFENNTAGVGGAFNVQGKSLEVDSASFKGNTSTANASSTLNSDFGGGAVRSKKAEVTLTGVSLDGDKSNYYGGAVHAIASTVTINGNSEIKNVSGATGGALYFKDSSEALLENVSLTKNTSLYNGVIYTASGNITLKNVNASENTAVNGGVLYVSGASTTAEITGGVWSNNTANQGGTLVINTAKAQADGIKFIENSAKLGGAVYIVRGEFTVDNVEFTGNSSVMTEDGKSGNGGAVSISAGKVTASENVIFKGNSAENHGGAVYVSYANNDDGTKTPGELYMNGGLFENNTAVSGGAVSSRTSCITGFTGTEFKNNSASGSSADGGGGVIYTNDNKLTLSGVTATGNSTAYYGGAVTGQNAEITVNNGSLFSGNKGITGAVFNFRGNSKVSLDNVTVKDNINEKGSGNIYITNSGSLDINALTASGNVNTNGGVLYVSGSAVTDITDSKFTGNTANGIGGAVDHRSSGKLTVSGTSFTSNTAVNGGAVNLAGSGAVEIKNSTFESNAASVSGGALNITGSGQVTVSDDTLFKGNTAPTAGAVHLDSGAKANISQSSFEANSATGGDGGAVLVSDSSEEGKAATSLTVNNVSFNGNTASSKGGAISTDTESPNIIINAVSCVFNANKSIGAGGGAVEIQNGNCTTVNGPTVNNLIFTNCKFTENTSKTTGAAVEIRTSSCAKFDGVEATGNTTGSSKQHGGVFYVTSIHSRLYITGTVTQSGNIGGNGNFAYLYNSSSGYSNPPRIYTSHSSTASWVSDVGGNKTSMTFDVTSMP